MPEKLRQKKPGALAPGFNISDRSVLSELLQLLNTRFGVNLILQRITLIHIYEDRGGHEDGGISTGNYANKHCERKATCHLATEDEEDKDYKEYRQGRHDRAAQCIIDGAVDDALLAFARALTEVFAHAVKYNYRIVHGEADYRKQGCNKVLVNFQRKRHMAAKEGEYRQRDAGIVQQGDDSTQGILPLAEADEDVEEDGEQRDDGRLHSAALQVFGDDWQHCALLTRSAEVLRAESFHCCGSRNEVACLQAFKQLGAHLLSSILTWIFDEVRGSDVIGIVRTDGLHNRILAKERL